MHYFGTILDTSFAATVHAGKSGAPDVAYLHVSKTPVAKTVEVVEGVLLVDLDEHENLVGVEILAPVSMQQVLALAAKLAPTQRQAFETFVRSSAPPALVASQRRGPELRIGRICS